MEFRCFQVFSQDISVKVNKCNTDNRDRSLDNNVIVTRVIL